MTRATFAAIVLCSTLWAALGQIAPASFVPHESSSSATIAPAPPGCTSDHDGEWTPLPDATVCVTESGWKTRILHAALGSATDPRAVVAAALTDLPQARAPAARSYLLHVPLLI